MEASCCPGRRMKQWRHFVPFILQWRLQTCRVITSGWEQSWDMESTPWQLKWWTGPATKRRLSIAGTIVYLINISLFTTIPIQKSCKSKSSHTFVDLSATSYPYTYKIRSKHDWPTLMAVWIQEHFRDKIKFSRITILRPPNVWCCVTATISKLSVGQILLCKKA